MHNSSDRTSLLPRKTFAIISHPDAGKTTLTEQFLRLGKVVRAASQKLTEKTGKSDWMAIEKSRGISVSTSVMQFPYKGTLLNLLDTPGHEDFSEDTYRTLTAVDSVLMVIDAAKGVEVRTKKLIEVIKPRKTPIISFINKLDRDSQDPMRLLSEIEASLGIACVPITWPVGCGSQFQGVYHLLTDTFSIYPPALKHRALRLPAMANTLLTREQLPSFLEPNEIENLCEAIGLLKGAGTVFSQEAFLNGTLSPLFFGTALTNFAVDTVLTAFTQWAPHPLSRLTTTREVRPEEPHFTGFVFKIQANMNPKHHDRIAFVRVVSGTYKAGMRLKHTRTGKSFIPSMAIAFVGSDRLETQIAYPGDIIGLYNHGTIGIGDTFTEGEALSFIGIPHFAPELFKKIRLHDPLKQKRLMKGLLQLCEEGAVQIFKPLMSNDFILGAIGPLQFDVVISRLANEYHINASYEATNIAAARWILCQASSVLKEFEAMQSHDLAWDAQGRLIYLASSTTKLQWMASRYPAIDFLATKEL